MKNYLFIIVLLFVVGCVRFVKLEDCNRIDTFKIKTWRCKANTAITWSDNNTFRTISIQMLEEPKDSSGFWEWTKSLFMGASNMAAARLGRDEITNESFSVKE